MKSAIHDDSSPALSLDDGVATITFQRPAQHNRIDPDDVTTLQGYVTAIGSRADVAALVFTGSGGKTFSSGYTIDAIVERLDRSFEDLLDAIEDLPIPTIAAINGSVYGGATDLALCCDFRIGVHGSRMFMPSARFGLHYYPGGLRRYITILGVAQAKRLFLTGQSIDGGEMLRIGFLTELVHADALRQRIDDYVTDLKAGDPAAISSMKRQLNTIARAESAAGASREAYEQSLHSAELRRRLAVLRDRDLK
jgi:enoyl-CoA hydratase/carnithine racemase